MVSKHSTLGSLIRLVRKKNSWTLRQLSEKVGIPLSTLAKVETDKLSLTYDKLQQFTASLGLSMTEFLAQGEAPPRSRTSLQHDTLPRPIEISGYLRRLVPVRTFAQPIDNNIPNRKIGYGRMRTDIPTRASSNRSILIMTCMGVPSR